jgi:UPF0755 protein
MNFKKIYPFIILLIVVLFIGGNFIYNILSYNYNVPLNFKIKKGASVDEITKELEKENIISSSFSFKLYLILTGKHKNIKAGNYKIERPFNMIELSNILIKGGEGVKIKIIPGMTLKDIELLFKENGLNVNFQKYKLSHFSDLNLYNIFEDKILEGFLMPDTYEFFEETEEEIIKKILLNFQKKALPYLEKIENPYQALIVASLIEKEIIPIEDRFLASDVIWKRLKNNWTLDVDASLVYAKCNGFYFFCKDKKLTSSDLKSQNKYNVYIFKGLPPTPISNPSINSIIAAINPKKNDFYFYFTTKDGKTIFSKTLKEHEEKLKILR